MTTCRFRHAAAERIGLADSSVDLVSMCLVMHELPQHATRAIIAEAFRILRPGGTFAIMVGCLPQQKRVEPCCGSRRSLEFFTTSSTGPGSMCLPLMSLYQSLG